ncbi:MAG: hypothetical protein ACF8SC_03090 [Phycisphaerales bacterium JB037]
MRTRSRLIPVVAALACSMPASATHAPDQPAETPVLKESLAKAAQIIDRVGKNRDELIGEALFNLLLDTIEPHWDSFAKPRLGTPGNESDFQRITINKTGTGFDGLRIVPPAGGSWDLNWEFVIPDDAGTPTWYILSSEGALAQGFQSYDHYRNSRIRGHEVAPQNLHIVQPLTGGQLREGKDYLIWFRVKTDKPVELLVRIDLTPAPATDEPNG